MPNATVPPQESHAGGTSNETYYGTGFVRLRFRPAADAVVYKRPVNRFPCNSIALVFVLFDGDSLRSATGTKVAPVCL